ncbi:enoyl-CoA hydratase [Actinomadura rugatobispora]|uniref:Enoyl-CoA hydratase n=1 Tax=Actinomadura rugatobispora TaxID=1994 RepID=A0ABW0ZTC6_9ACTN|nr:enoyl-CoA hydratase family protein [Actinomadura rugatobispora]
MSIEFESADGIARVTLAAPERRNALTPDEFAQLRDVLAAIAASPSERVVVITGEGTAFCAGAALPPDRPQSPPIVLMRQINETARALHRMPQPCVAAVNGPAVGAGMSLALGCDFVIASTTATFSQIFVKRGLSPDFGSSWLLPRLVGLHTAKRLALLGDTIDAEQAAALGLAGEVVAPDELEAAVTELARRLAAGPPIALALTKDLLNQSLTTGFDDALGREAAAAATNLGAEDTTEAFAAFRERRAPQFKGR